MSDRSDEAKRLAVATVEGVIASARRVMTELPPGRWRDYAIQSLADAERWGRMAAREAHE